MVKRIILHWSAGRYYPTDFEKRYYHYLVSGDGKIYSGKYIPSDNDDCTDNNYAAHTGGGNTGSIGVCMCAMYGYKSSVNCGNYPITKLQFEACMMLCAKICKEYDIAITPTTVMTHYEFGQANPTTTSFGKIDITYIPPYPWVKKEDVGSFIRTKIRWYKEKL